MERAEPEGFQLPSAWRRVAVVFLYVVVSFVALSVASALVLSESCMYYDACTATDDLISSVLGIVWLGSLAAILVFGWRGQLYGCRRRPMNQAAR